ncbi:hypothetical protein AB0D04_19210 [Streptomyces sp. NPDC048483]|uniref:hypothetical protein n=1 Tax=Streptomyces sp. NPDC048483 TaxID=3154927 RepID=UPI00341F250B
MSTENQPRSSDDKDIVKPLDTTMPIGAATTPQDTTRGKRRPGTVEAKDTTMPIGDPKKQ